MNFKGVLEILLKSFRKEKIDCALIGGFAVAASGYPRATRDIDFLIDQKDREKVKQLMISFGYDPVHESPDVVNFSGRLKELGNVDFLIAHRKYARAMLARAREREILDGQFTAQLVIPEDIIGLKVQSSSNDQRRYHQDMADIEAIIKANRQDLDMELIREYFMLFDREDELEEIMEKCNEAE